MRSEVYRRWDTETSILAVLAACISLLAFLFYFRHGYVLLYGDAVAHINIARRVFDSRTPGLLQLGTVWLPLPHLLMIPFLFSHWAWQSGLGGSIPSLVAYVLGAVGIFRLVRDVLSFHSQPDTATRLTAWFAAGIYAANPNLIYLQATAMTEPLFLALSIWAIVYFTEFIQQNQPEEEDQQRASRFLAKCGLCLLGACLTRYDGWFLAAAMTLAGLLVVPKRMRGLQTLHRGFRVFVLLAAAGPVFWLAYNAAVYRNPLEFATGPYSARAIELKTSHSGDAPHPGANHLGVAASYFVKSAESNLAEGRSQKLWIALLLAGTVIGLVSDRRRWPLLFLWLPLPFYMLSIAYGGVPIFLPGLWPFSYYNVRYGLEMLPAFAVFVALTAYFVVGLARNRTGQAALAACFLALVAGGYATVWREHPICFREAWVNSRTRLALERELASTLKTFPPGSTFLMYLGDHVGALQDAGIPLRRTINEGNHRTWKQPSDPEGLWERALANPSQYADFEVAIGHDPVAEAIKHTHPDPLQVISEIHVNGQPAATIYRTHPATQGSGSSR